MNFEQQAKTSIFLIFGCIEMSKNQRIQNELQGVDKKILEKITLLQQQEEDEETLKLFLNKIQSIQKFAQEKGNLDKVWKLLHIKIYEAQDRMIEALKNLPQAIQEYIQKQNSTTESLFFGQSYVEMFSHQLIEFNIILYSPQQQFENQIQNDSKGILKYVSPKIDNQNIYSANILMKDLVRKIKKLESLLVKIVSDSQVLKFKFDHNKRKSIFWSMDQSIGYCLTTRSQYGEEPQIQQKIYLDSGMIIQLTKTFKITIKTSNNCLSKNQQVNQNFKPISLSENQSVSSLNKILCTEKTHFIELTNGFEDVIIYPSQIPIFLSKVLALPNGFDICIYNDGFGSYFEIIAQNQSYTPRILNENKQFQFETLQTDFSLGIVLQDNIQLWISSNISDIWSGKDLVEF